MDLTLTFSRLSRDVDAKLAKEYLALSADELMFYSILFSHTLMVELTTTQMTQTCTTSLCRMRRTETSHSWTVWTWEEPSIPVYREARMSSTPDPTALWALPAPTRYKVEALTLWRQTTLNRILVESLHLMHLGSRPTYDWAPSDLVVRSRQHLLAQLTVTQTFSK